MFIRDSGPRLVPVDTQQSLVFSVLPLQCAPVPSNPTFSDCCLVWTIFLGASLSAAQGSLQLRLHLVLTPPPPHQTFLST